MTNKTFEEAYSESGFWDKLEKFGKNMGRATVKNALRLFYSIYLGKANPAQVSIIIGALGYLIFPVDAIPDVMPGGLTDDAGVLTAAVGLLACCSDAEVEAAAKAKASEWFD